jgi:ubiquinone/menaquinone biosynthesis C-methylase UbiE
VIEKQKTRDFWQDVANNAPLADEAMAGMLTDGNAYISRLRQEGEERHFLKAFKLSPDMHLLEVGTGGGRWAFFLSDKVSSVVGIDFSSKMIELANLALQRKAMNNVSFAVAELLEYETDARFDIIYFSGMLQYLTDDEVAATLEHAKGLLSDNGYFISRDSVQGLQRVVLDAEHSVIYRTVAEYQALFAKAGFELTYNEVSYPETRFSTFASKLYELPLVNYGVAHFVHRVLLGVNRLLGDPRWLKKSHHKAALDSVGVRDHRFFRYERRTR